MLVFGANVLFLMTYRQISWQFLIRQAHDDAAEGGLRLRIAGFLPAGGCNARHNRCCLPSHEAKQLPG